MSGRKLCSNLPFQMGSDVVFSACYSLKKIEQKVYRFYYKKIHFSWSQQINVEEIFQEH